jgi:hypothetical protein
MTNALPASQFLIYQTEDGRTKLDVRFEDESVWLTQHMMVELFQSSKQNISHHIKSIYAEGELQPEATVKKYLTVQSEGARQVKRQMEYYNLDVIISVGYRVKSHVATKFRIWATQQLREFIVKCFVQGSVAFLKISDTPESQCVYDCGYLIICPVWPGPLAYPLISDAGVVLSNSPS